MSEYRGYIVKPLKDSPKLLTISTAGQGGKIPKMLEGLFTSRLVAHGLIDHYLNTKEQENGKKVRQSGD